MLAKITVASYKSSGKFYSRWTSPLKDEHRDLEGFELSKLIKTNHPSVQGYSDLVSGFGGSYYYVVEVEYPDDVNKFCNFVFDNTRAHD